jgi:hypothetical protein
VLVTPKSVDEIGCNEELYQLRCGKARKEFLDRLWFLRAFAELRKATRTFMSVCLSVCQSVSLSVRPTL